MDVSDLLGAVGECEGLVVQGPDLDLVSGVFSDLSDDWVAVVLEPVEVGAVEPHVIDGHERHFC